MKKRIYKRKQKKYYKRKNKYVKRRRLTKKKYNLSKHINNILLKKSETKYVTVGTFVNNISTSNISVAYN